MRGSLRLLVLAIGGAACASPATPALATAPAFAKPTLGSGPSPAASAAPSSAATVTSANANANANASANASADPADVRSANAFTAHLYARLAKTPGNLMVSGTSLRTALGVALLGARG